MINNQNIDDNEYWKWWLVSYLHPADSHPAKIKKAGKYFAKRTAFRDIKLPDKIRFIHKIEKKNLLPLAFLVMKKRKKYPVYISKIFCEENMLIY